MASAEDYAAWIVANKDKQGTPEFETVANAYKLARSGAAQPKGGDQPKLRLDAAQPPTWLESVAAKLPSNLFDNIPVLGTNIDISGSKLRRFMEGAADPTIGGLQIAGNLVGKGDEWNQIVADREANIPKVEGFDGARVLGNVFSPASVGAVKAIPVAAQAATLPGKIARYLQTVGVGGATGAGLSALNPTEVKDGETYGGNKTSQVKEGAVIGAAIPATLGPLITAAVKGSAWAIDALNGQLGKVKAAQIIRDAAGDKLPQIRAAASVGGNDLTAAQAAAGANQDTFSALGEVAKRNDKNSYYANLAEVQKQAQIEAIRKIAGGANQTEARAVREQTKQSLNNVAAPDREIALAAADTAGTTGRALKQRADSLKGAAASKVEDVRRMENLGASADDMSQAGRNTADGTMNLRGQELGRRAEQVSQKSADDSLILGEGGRFAQSQADSLEAYGLRPLDADGITSALKAKLQNPDSAGSRTYENVITRVIDDIEKWKAANGGQISAKALYAIRKNSVGDAVADLTKGMEPKASAKYAAGALKDVQPRIDEAIINAGGGPEWTNYLKTYGEGMQQVNQQKMGAKALESLQKSPDQFVNLANGNEPKMVEKAFGPGSFDLYAEMGDKGNAIRQVADALMRDKGIEAGAGRASTAIGDILKQDIGGFRIPNFMNAKAAVANKGLEKIEASVSKKTMDAIVEGMKSGRSAVEMMDLLPMKERNQIMAEIIRQRGMTKQIAAAAIAANNEKRRD